MGLLVPALKTLKYKVSLTIERLFCPFSFYPLYKNKGWSHGLVKYSFNLSKIWSVTLDTEQDVWVVCCPQKEHTQSCDLARWLVESYDR